MMEGRKKYNRDNSCGRGGRGCYVSIKDSIKMLSE